jgi:DNA-directed RNA polymerase subunit RPC12/RpoP
MYKCPDCKIELTKDDIVDSAEVDAKGEGICYEVPVYQCPKCGAEYEKYLLNTLFLRPRTWIRRSNHGR